MKTNLVLFVLFLLHIQILSDNLGGLGEKRMPTEEEKDLFYLAGHRHGIKYGNVHFIDVQTQIVSGTKYIFNVKLNKMRIAVSFVYASWSDKPFSDFEIQPLNLKGAF